MKENAKTYVSRLNVMAPMSETEVWLMGMAIVVVLLCLLIALTLFIYRFSRELRYLNMEIQRTQGEERGHYIRRRRKLWLSLIPFVRY